MTTFIPQQLGAQSAQGILLKRALSGLDDDHVARTPLRPGPGVPDLVVQHPALGWLALAVCDVAPGEVVDERLVATAAQVALEARLAEMDGLPDEDGGGMGKLVAMWRCSPDQVRLLAARYADRFDVRLIARDTLLDLGDQVIPSLLAPIESAAEQSVMGRWFPETEIDPAWTTRRVFVRDNSAGLTRFFMDVAQERAVKSGLHPGPQEDAAARDLSIRLVNGVAGSGKTLIALARARLLAERFPQHRVQVLIHNTPIVADLNARLARASDELPANLAITTFQAWAHRQWRNLHGRSPSIAGPRLVERVIDRIRSRWPQVTVSSMHLREELDFIDDSLITGVEAYRTVSRSGRGFAMRDEVRGDVWQLLAAVRSELARTGHITWSAIARDICLAADHTRLEQFDHVVVDEAQFFAPAWFRAVQLALRPAGSLFLCADPNQGFLRRRLSWKRVGLDVSGRTRRLRRSYRSTRAILEAATRVLVRCAPGDPEDFLVPEVEGMEPGEPPVLISVDAPQDAVDRVVNEVHALVERLGVPLADLLVVYGDGVPRDLVHRRLCARLGAAHVWWLNHPDQKKAPPRGSSGDHLRLANLGTATGLEAPIVFLLGLEGLLATIEVGADVEEEARRLYMAMTRAGSRLVVITSRPLPDFLVGAFQPVPGADAR